MNYPNNDFLRTQLEKDGDRRASAASFVIDDNEYRQHLDALVKTSKEPVEILRDRAAYRCLTFNQKPRSEMAQLLDLLSQTNEKLKAQEGMMLQNILTIVIVVELFLLIFKK